MVLAPISIARDHVLIWILMSVKMNVGIEFLNIKQKNTNVCNGKYACACYYVYM